ncbi:ribosome maturation factor RimP [Janibacter alkaliphilus]|uniref:Ribosome maturation factor RimP n=1 Tax=Janibacter alkaliphilus TaxID=1069963 RepID=A0A852XGW2_9MICO|nr:ribosome maturation factor RimP [Janibacter alkaliphilus]NYG37651.1 ribosome maturation factor RimP [Janibacter alkaliphilus]
MSLEQDLRTLLSESLGAGVDVDSVVVTPAGRRRVARVVVERPLPEETGDSPVEPLTLDEIGEITRQVSETLDETDLMGAQPYTLEVTTPGTDRPLTTPAHFRRNVSRLVTLTTADGEVTGRIVSVSGDGVSIETPATKKAPAQRREIPFADITKGAVQVEFNRPTDPTTQES